MKYFLINDKGKKYNKCYVFLCSYCAYWIINVYYAPTYAQIICGNLY
jgi:hypothetical protein